MSKKLFVHNDAPPQLKQNIRFSQEILDNMQNFKGKADDGTLTSADLKEMSRLNNQIVAKFSGEGTATGVGLGSKVKSPEELLVISRSRVATVQAKAGVSPYPVNSLDDLKTLCKMSPEKSGALILKAAEKIKAEKKAEKAKGNTGKADAGPQKQETKIKIDGKIVRTKLGYSTKLEDEIFELLSFAYRNCKPRFFAPIEAWTNVVVMEDQIINYLKIIEQNGDGYVSNIFKIVFDADSDMDKEIALFILASIRPDEDELIGMIVDMGKDDEELLSKIETGLKYGINPIIPHYARFQLLNGTDDNKPIFMEVLDYHRDPNDYSHILDKSPPALQAKILKKNAKAGVKTDFASFYHLLENPEEPYFKDALLTGLLSGDKYTLMRCRRVCDENYDKAGELLIYLACAGNYNDFSILSRCLKTQKPSIDSIRALSLFGRMDVVPELIQFLNPESFPVESKEDFNRKNSLFECLNVLTGASLVMSDPDIEETEGEEQNRITVQLDYFEPWKKWWSENNMRFNNSARYRRGEIFTLKSCLKEMENPTACYWSRQYSYYELMIRSGKKMPFESDWYVKDQQTALQEWYAASEGQPWLNDLYPWTFAAIS